MFRNRILALLVISLLSLTVVLPLLASAKSADVQLTVLELKANGKPGGGGTMPPTDNSMTNLDYKTLRFHWFTTAKYWINSASAPATLSTQVPLVVQASTNTWDIATKAVVFAYQGDDASLTAGVRDGKNVVDFGSYSNNNVIAVTFIWSRGNSILETDLRMNIRYTWVIASEGTVPSGMDMQSILTHEFGHWAGLDDLYNNADYWLTMYGYANNGQTWKQSLGQGDINGIRAVYGQ